VLLVRAVFLGLENAVAGGNPAGTSFSIFLDVRERIDDNAV
jgi:hypothetical protein